MLKIEIGNHNNVVIGKVLEQGDEIKRGGGIFFTSPDGFELYSGLNPKLYCDGIFEVRGTFDKLDNICACYAKSNETDAINLVGRIKLAVREYNQSLKEKPTNTTKINLGIVE